MAEYKSVVLSCCMLVAGVGGVLILAPKLIELSIYATVIAILLGIEAGFGLVWIGHIKGGTEVNKLKFGFLTAIVLAISVFPMSYLMNRVDPFEISLLWLSASFLSGGLAEFWFILKSK